MNDFYEQGVQIEAMGLNAAMTRIRNGVARHQMTHGNEAFVSRHEIFGVIAMQFRALAEAVGRPEVNFNAVILDLLVACAWSIASADPTGCAELEL